MKRLLPLRAAIILFVISPDTDAADFVATNTSDSGAGSFRQALEDAGGTLGGPHNIRFAIPGAGPHTIAPSSQLPTPDQPVVIDGYTQPGATNNTASNAFNAVLKIRLDGGGFGVDGLRLRQPGNVVRGLAFIRWTGNGVDIAEGGSNRISGCSFGIDVDGANRANTGPAISITSEGNEIGGLNPADRNVISFNTFGGIALTGAGASNNSVRGNFIGTDFSGTVRNANSLDGVGIYGAPNNVVGGTEPGARNLISGNFLGVHIQYGGAVGNVVQGNLIGTDINGTNSVFNNTDGVRITSSVSNLIGGASVAARNVISGNNGNGVGQFSGATGNRVLGNWIGVSVTGGDLTNGGSGLNIEGNSNQVGGVAASEGNVIANSTGSGVRVNPNSIGNAIRGNQIYGTVPAFAGSSALGIDLSGDGVTANDAGDADAGANNFQNFPVITNAASDVSSVTIQGELDTGTNQTFQLDFYANITCNTSGHGEGRFYFGSTTVNTDGNGYATFSVTFPGTSPGSVVTATATDAEGSTSEFSVCQTVTFNIPPQTFTVINTNDSGPGSLRQASSDSNGHLSSSNNTIAFNISGAGMRVISLLAVLPPFTQPVTIDGFTQTDASANTLSEGSDAVWMVELNGSMVTPAFTADGLRLNIPNLVVRGLRIAGFGRDGILMESGAFNCVVAGNCIVTNGNAGVTLSNAVANRVGGSLPADRNLISGNPSYGVHLQGTACRNNTIHGNLIGADASGSQSFGASQFQGVSLSEASSNAIGGTNAGQANLIAFNSSGAVSVYEGTNNPIRGNRIFSNGGRGIALTGFLGNGDVNDADDSDSGANDLQNFPVLSNATASVGSTMISGSLSSRPNQAYTLDFYTSSSACGFFGGQGEFYLGSATVMTDGAGTVSFNVVVPANAQRPYLLATATDTNGNTSQFSDCIEPVLNLPGLTYQVVNTNDSGPGSLRQAIFDTGVVPNSTPDMIHFSISGPGVKIIRPLTPLPEPPTQVIIDGYSQPGASANTLSNADNAVLLIQLDGSAAGGTAFTLANSGNTIRGLSIIGFDRAFALNAGSNVVEGNWIGFTPAGSTNRNNLEGVFVSSAGNRIGGTTPAARNIISGNGREGVFISGASASGNVVQGNFIGVGPSGTNAPGNGEDGVLIAGARGNLIGGTNSGAGNLIGGSFNYGVRITGVTATLNRVEGNFIGPSFDFEAAMTNRSGGVLIAQNASTNTIGGRVDEAGNHIAYNNGPGVWVQTGTQNAVLWNEIVDNNGKDIQVSFGANDNVQPPVLISAAEGNTIVKGQITGAQPNTTYELTVKAKYKKQGKRRALRLGSIQIMTDASGNADFNQTFNRNVPRRRGARVTANLTCLNSSSEESNDTAIIGANEVDLQTYVDVIDPIARGSNTVVTITITNAGPTNATSVEVVSTQPPGSTLMSTTNPNGATTTDGPDTTMQFGSLAPGQGKSATVVLRGDLPGVRHNCVHAHSMLEIDGDPLNNVAMGTFFVLPDPGNVDVSVVSLGASTLTPIAGAPYTYNAVIQNFSTFPAANVYFEADALTPAIIFTGATSPAGPLTTSSSAVRGSLGTIGAFQTVTITLDAVGTYPAQSAEIATRLQSSAPEYFFDNNLVYRAVNVRPWRLNVQRDGDNVQLTWPAGSVNHAALEESTAVGDSALWIPSTSGTLSNNGTTATYTVPASNPAAFYRLRRVEPPPMEGVTFHQLDMTLDGVRHPFSEWGQAEVIYRGTNPPIYLNVVRGSNWVVQNLPLLSPNGTNASHSNSVSFRLTSYGTMSSNDNFGFSLSSNTMSIPPSINISNAMVFPRPKNLNSGIKGDHVVYRPPQTIFSTLVRTSALARPNYPNVEQGMNECGPGAILNSLTYLNREHQLNIASNYLTMDAMKEATSWDSDGVYGAFLFIDSWVEDKDEYMQANNLPIETIRSTTDLTNVMFALSQTNDVEIEMEGHVAVVLSIAALTNGNYQFVLSDDGRQGQAGGLEPYSVLYDAHTGYLIGTGWARKFENFIIERPKF